MKLHEEIVKAHSVKRWSGTYLLGHRRSISEHLSEVAIVCLYMINQLEDEHDIKLHKGARFDILHLALTHDLPEVYTSDIPYTAKRKHPEIKKCLTAIEEDYKLSNGIPIEFDDLIEFFVKVADIIVVAVELIDEINYSNKAVSYDNIVAMAKANYDKYKYLLERPEDERVADFLLDKLDKLIKMEEGNYEGIQRL